jgi:hypothetical protein
MMAPKAGSTGATAMATATVMDDPDTEKPQTFRSLSKLAEYCGVKDVEGFKTWLNGSLFQPTFQQFYDEAIAPQQQKASGAGKDRPRAMNAKTIESVMQLGEAHGSRMFSARRVDKTDWELPEYYAYCMYNLITDNSQDFKGLFYGRKNVREHTKFCRLWACLQFELYEMAPSRQARRKEAEKKAEAKEAKRVAKEADGKSKKKRKPKDGKASQVIDDEVQVVNDEVTEVAGDDTSVADGQEVDDKMNEEDRLHLERVVGRQQHHQENVNSFINHVYTGQSGILNEMLLECKHAEMNLEDRFWQDYLLGLLDEAFSSKYRLTKGDMVNTTEALDATDEMMRDAIEKTGDSSDLLPVKLATNEDFEAYRTNAILQDNIRFQPQGHRRACDRLRLDADHPRFDCMPLHKPFQFWQVVAIAQMMRFSKSLRGCLLCDSMGLGKTWELVGLVLQVSQHLSYTHSIFLGRLPNAYHF